MKKWKFWLGGILGVLVLVLGLRIALPFYLEHRINESLASHPTYLGEVKDVDISVFQLELVLHELKLSLRDQPEAFAARIDEWITGLSWKSFFSEEWILSSQILGAQVQMAYPGISELKKPDQTQKFNFKEDLPQFRIDSLEVEDAELELVFNGEKAQERLELPSIYISLTDFANWGGKRASLSLWAQIAPSGVMHADMQMNPVDSPPDFQLSFYIKNLSLPSVNALVREKLSFDFEQGSLNLFAELSSQDGSYSGYLKPLLHNVEILTPEDFQEKGIGALVDLAADFVKNIFENEEQEQVATRIPLEGQWADPELQIGPAIVTLLQNEIFKALSNEFVGQAEKPNL